MFTGNVSNYFSMLVTQLLYLKCLEERLSSEVVPGLN